MDFENQEAAGQAGRDAGDLHCFWRSGLRLLHAPVQADDALLIVTARAWASAASFWRLINPQGRRPVLLREPLVAHDGLCLSLLPLSLLTSIGKEEAKPELDLVRNSQAMADSAPPAVLFTVLPYWFDGGNPAAAPAGIFSSIGPAAHPGEPEAGPSGFTRTVAVPTSVPSSLHIQSASATLALSRRPLVTSSATNLLLSATASIAGAAQAAGGASGSQFVLSSLATQPTPSASASASSGTAHTSADTSSAQQAASTSQANETWPLTLAVMLLVSLGIYLLMVSPILGGYLASGRWRSRSYFLSPSAAKAASAGGVNMPYPQRARPASKFTAWVRGAYNRSLLVQLPLVRLTLGQCLVLFVYTACVVIATFTQSGNVGKDAIRSGRIA